MNKELKKVSVTVNVEDRHVTIHDNGEVDMHHVSTTDIEVLRAIIQVWDKEFGFYPPTDSNSLGEVEYKDHVKHTQHGIGSL